MVRVAGFAVIAAAAVLVWFLMAPSAAGPTVVTPGGYSALISAALADNAENEDNASSAPQQQVTNGWVARDLLLIQARQGDDLLAQNAQVLDVARDRDDRIPALLVIVVIAICWHGLTVTRRRSTAGEPSLLPSGTPRESSSPSAPIATASGASPNSPT